MKAVVIDSFGGVDKLKVSDIPKPIPADNEVLLHVSHAGVNPVDWKIREGWLKNMIPHEFPLVPGWDAAGSIAAIGKNVATFQEGDEVFAYCRKPLVKFGTYAEYVAIDADYLAYKPERISMAQAAAIPLVGLTAWQALFDFARLRYGETILIHAAAGGVGGLAVQFAKIAGAKVIATASKINHDYVKRLGADIVLDYHDNLAGQVASVLPNGADVVLDCVGGQTLKDSVQYVRKHGRLASIVDPRLDQSLVDSRRIKFGWVFVHPNGSQLNQIANLIALDKVSPPNIEVLPLEQAGNAQEKNREGHVRGKLVLQIKNT